MTRMQTHSLRAAAVVTLLHVTLWCGATTHAAVDLTVENVKTAAGSEVEVPISVRGASGLEGIQFVLTFDPESLEFLDVTPAPLAGAADIHLKQRAPGTVRVAVLPEAMLNSDDGTLLLARFQVLAGDGKELPVGIVEAKASEFHDQFPVWMHVTATQGSVITVAAPALPAWLWLAILPMMILAIVLLRLFRRKEATS